MIHQLKTKHKYFEDIASGDKTFEVRRNDRDFKIGDFLALNELDDHMAKTSDQTEKETGRCCIVRVGYILDTPDFCKEGYVILGIEPCTMVTRDNRRQIYDYPKERVPVYGRKEVQPKRGEAMQAGEVKQE